MGICCWYNGNIVHGAFLYNRTLNQLVMTSTNSWLRFLIAEFMGIETYKIKDIKESAKAGMVVVILKPVIGDLSARKTTDNMEIISIEEVVTWALSGAAIKPDVNSIPGQTS
jgi:hypothetical protein